MVADNDRWDIWNYAAIPQVANIKIPLDLWDVGLNEK
jgi:hypothetical protein